MMKKDLPSLAYDWLKHQILTFRLLPGVKLSDQEVAQHLGISRSPVREALTRLVEHGLVEARHNRGFTVKVFSIREVEDLYSLRANLEKMAVGLTTRHLTEENAQEFEDLLRGYPDLMKTQDLVGFNDADEQFHELIARYSQNAILYEVLKNLQGRIRLARRYDHLRATSFQETYDEHMEIFGFMRQGDADRAEQAMAGHILRSMQYIVNVPALKDFA